MAQMLGESFRDAHGIEIGACAIFKHFAPSSKIDGTGKKMTESILWDKVETTPRVSEPRPKPKPPQPEGKTPDALDEVRGVLC